MLDISHARVNDAGKEMTEALQIARKLVATFPNVSTQENLATTLTFLAAVDRGQNDHAMDENLRKRCRYTKPLKSKIQGCTLRVYKKLNYLLSNQNIRIKSGACLGPCKH